jgi:hypothetical protein
MGSRNRVISLINSEALAASLIGLLIITRRSSVGVC